RRPDRRSSRRHLRRGTGRFDLRPVWQLGPSRAGAERRQCSAPAWFGARGRNPNRPRLSRRSTIFGRSDLSTAAGARLHSGHVSIDPQPCWYQAMIDFDLTEEQRLLEQTVRDWARREVAPRIKELDRAHTFDPKILPQMAELGLLGISVPVEYGGAGMDYVALGLASEELEYVDTSLRVIMSVHAGLNCLSLLTWGTGDQKKRYLIPQAQGKKIATY